MRGAWRAAASQRDGQLVRECTLGVLHISRGLREDREWCRGREGGQRVGCSWSERGRLERVESCVEMKACVGSQGMCLSRHVSIRVCVYGGMCLSRHVSEMQTRISCFAVARGFSQVYRSTLLMHATIPRPLPLPLRLPSAAARRHTHYRLLGALVRRLFSRKHARQHTHRRWHCFRSCLFSTQPRALSTT